MKNKFLFRGYYDILFKEGSRDLIFFCELNSFNSSALRLLKRDLKKNNFLIKNVKTKIINFCLKNNFLKKLAHGPLFLLYKEQFGFENDLVVIKKLVKQGFILGCFYSNKFYSFEKLKIFYRYGSISQFFSLIFNNIKFLLYINFYSLVKCIPKK